MKPYKRKDRAVTPVDIDKVLAALPQHEPVKLDEDRQELAAKLGENIVVAGGGAVRGRRRGRDRRLLAPAGEQARCARPGPRRLG